MSDDAEDIDAYFSKLMSLRAKALIDSPPVPNAIPLAPPVNSVPQQMVPLWQFGMGVASGMQAMNQSQQFQALQNSSSQQLTNMLGQQLSQANAPNPFWPNQGLGAGNPWINPRAQAFRHSGKLKRLRYLHNTLGWRAWKVADVRDVKVAHHKDWLTSVRRATKGLFVQAQRQLVLQSPQQNTLWEDAELHCEKWDKDKAVRGHSGIHALLAPENWRDLTWEYDIGQTQITGLVERFGNFVLGEDGWRAEWVRILELSVPTKELADELAETYPEVKIHTDEE